MTCPTPCACDVDAWHDGPAAFAPATLPDVGDWLRVQADPTREGPVERIVDGWWWVDGDPWVVGELEPVEAPEGAGR